MLTAVRPYFGLIVLVTMLLTAAGVYSMLHMPSGIYPEVAFPRIIVIVETPGLAVKNVEVGVTRPIEEAINGVLGVTRVQSKSVRGAAEIRVDFVPGTDMIQALNDARAKMADVMAQLPPGTKTTVDRKTPSFFPIISFVVTGGRDPRRCTTMPTTICSPASAVCRTFPTSRSRGAIRARSSSRSIRSPRSPPACRWSTWPTSWTSSTA